jgi:hypothetical protein
MGGNVTDWGAGVIQRPRRVEERLWRAFSLGLHGRAQRAAPLRRQRPRQRQRRGWPSWSCCATGSAEMICTFRSRGDGESGRRGRANSALPYEGNSQMQRRRRFQISDLRLRKRPRQRQMQILHPKCGLRMTEWAGFGMTEWKIGRKSPTRKYAHGAPGGKSKRGPDAC